MLGLLFLAISSGVENLIAGIARGARAHQLFDELLNPCGQVEIVEPAPMHQNKILRCNGPLRKRNLG
jgi:hypothetical protein